MPNNDYVKREDIYPAVTEIAKEIVFGGQDDDKVVDIINSIPSADAVPVVRCKECRYWEKVEYYPDGYKMCCRLLRAEMHGECFCSLGTRKEKENAEIH